MPWYPNMFGKPYSYKGLTGKALKCEMDNKAKKESEKFLSRK